VGGIGAGLYQPKADYANSGSVSLAYYNRVVDFRYLPTQDVEVLVTDLQNGLNDLYNLFDSLETKLTGLQASDRREGTWNPQLNRLGATTTALGEPPTTPVLPAGRYYEVTVTTAPVVATATADVTFGSSTLSVANLAGIGPGHYVVGAGIPAGTRVAYTLGTTQVVLSAVITTTAGTAVTFMPKFLAWEQFYAGDLLYSDGRNFSLRPGLARVLAGAGTGGAPYTAGAGIAISAQNVISATSTASSGAIDYANPVALTGGAALDATAFGKHHVCSGTGVALWAVQLPNPAGHAGKLLQLTIADTASGMWAFQAADINGLPERRLWAGEGVLLKCTGTGYVRLSGTTKPLCARIQANGAGNISFGVNGFFTLNLPNVLYDQSPGALMTATANQITVLRPGKYTLNGSFMGKYFQQNPELDLLCSFNGHYANLGTLTDLGSCYQPANITAAIRLKITGVMNLQTGNFYTIQLYSEAPGELDNRGDNPSYIPALELIENPSWT